MTIKIFYAMLLLLFSCSHLEQRGAPLSGTVDTNIQKISLNGTGKGRIITNGVKRSFSFESKLDKTSNKFIVQVALPLIGEEIVIIDLVNGVASGDFYNRMSDGINTEEGRDYINGFIRDISKIILSIRNGKCERSIACDIDVDTLNITMSKANRQKMVFSARELIDGKFKTVYFSLKKNGTDEELLAMQLIYNEWNN